MLYIADVKGYIPYSEYILWFADYINKLFKVSGESYNLSILHALSMKDGIGLCPASYHKNSFQALLKLMLERDTDSFDGIRDQVESYKKTILYTKAEKAPLLPQRAHDPYVVMYILIALFYVMGAILSALELKTGATFLSFEITSFKVTTFLSNMFFYMPLVFAEILVHKGYIKKKEEALVAESQRKHDNQPEDNAA